MEGEKHTLRLFVVSWIRLSILSSISYYFIILYYVSVNLNASKEVPLDDYGGEVASIGLGGNQLEFMCDMDTLISSLSRCQAPLQLCFLGQIPPV
jgi:hypothetical protein